MALLGSLLQLLFYGMYLIVIAGVILSWVRLGVGDATWLYHPILSLINNLADRISRPARLLLDQTGISRLVRPFDISPIITIFGLGLIEQLIARLFGLG